MRNAAPTVAATPEISSGKARTPSPYSTPSPPLMPQVPKKKIHAPFSIRYKSLMQSKSLMSSFNMYISLLFFILISSLLIYLAPYLSILLAFRLTPDDNFYSHRLGKIYSIPHSAKGMSEVAMLPDDDIPSLTSTSKAPSVNADMSIPLFSKKALKQRKHEDEWCPKNGITNTMMDGFSAQYHELISLYFFTKLRKVPFCTMPWKSFQSSVNATDMFYWVGGDKYGPPANAGTKPIASKVDLFKEHKIKDFYDQFEEAVSFVRQAYFSTPKPRLIFYEKGRFDIALHLPPGAIDDIMAGLDECLWKLKILYTQRKDELDLHLFSSQSDEKPFETLVINHPKMKLHLNKDVKSVFHHLVMADALIISKAVFSRTAALLSSWGDIFYIDHMKTPIKDWSSCQGLGWEPP